MNPSKILIIAGPTAVGKTALTIELAKHLKTDIISSDSMQIYKDMNIGSAKPSLLEQEGVKHHLIDFVEPTDNYSVSQFASDARQVIASLIEQNKIPIITGGTGLYINSLLYRMDFSNSESNQEVRNHLLKRCSTQGIETLYAELQQRAPQIALRIHPNNVHKILRALEIVELGGKQGDFSSDLEIETDYNPVLIVLNRNRTELYSRIESRVDLMLKQGLVDEVSGLMARGLTSSHQAMKGIGYKEVIDYLNGNYSYDDMVGLLKQNTRRYAKRQLTWFKRYHQAQWLNLSENHGPNYAFDAIIDMIGHRQTF